MGLGGEHQPNPVLTPVRIGIPYCIEIQHRHPYVEYATYSALADGQPLEWHYDGVLLALLWVFRFFALDI